MRFESKDGTSHRFWEISAEGDKLTTRWGTTGSDGKEKVKTCKSRWDARQQLRAAVEGKKKEGYEEVLQPPPKPERNAARNPELEALIVNDPDNAEAYLVYGDWLQGQGDPRGELIAAEHALLEAPRSKRLQETVARLRLPYYEQLRQLSEAFSLAPPPGEDHRLEVDWRLGFICRARLAYDWFAEELHDDAELGKVMRAFLALPSTHLLRELTLGLWRDSGGQAPYDGFAKALTRQPLPSLRKLFVADFEYPDQTEMSWTELGDWSSVWPAVPNLRELILQGGSVKLGAIDLPELRSFELRTGGLSRASARAIAAARWPKLERLVIWLGAKEYGGSASLADLRPILAGQGIAAVRELGLMNSELSDELCRALVDAPILEQLESLDLSMGLMSDAGAETLAAARPRLGKLRTLDVSRGYLTPAGIARIADLAPTIISHDQRTPDAYDGQEYRYVSVGE
jgi:uncharacterized protein (TIGR02996 family)